MMRKFVSMFLLVLFGLTMFAVPVFAEPPEAGGTDPVVQTPAEAPVVAAPTTTTVPSNTTAADPGKKIGGITDKISGLGAGLVVLMITVAGIVMMFSGAQGKKLLIWAIAGAAVVLGGWKLIVELVQFLVQ